LSAEEKAKLRATSKVIWDFDEESDEDEDEDEDLHAPKVGKSNAVSSDNNGDTKFDNRTAFIYMFYYAHRFICKRSNESITK